MVHGLWATSDNNVGVMLHSETRLGQGGKRERSYSMPLLSLGVPHGIKLTEKRTRREDMKGMEGIRTVALLSPVARHVFTQ